MVEAVQAALEKTMVLLETVAVAKVAAVQFPARTLLPLPGKAAVAAGILPSELNI